MRARGFTLIELLVVIAIMATMAAVGVVGVNAARDGSRQAGASRDVMAMIRRARSLALITQKPVALEYLNTTVDGEARADVKIIAEELFKKPDLNENIYNLDGDIVLAAETADESERGGRTMQDYFSPQSLPEDVLKGLKLLVEDETELSGIPEDETRRSKIDIFSTAANISRTVTASDPSAKDAEKKTSAEKDEMEEPFKVVFATNGKVSPAHRITLYADGHDPKNGYVIHVDRFGDISCEADK